MSGARSAEPTSVAIVSSVQTLTYILLNTVQLAINMNEEEKMKGKKFRIVGRDSICLSFKSKIKCIHSQNCLNDMNSMIKSCIVKNASDIVGYDINGVPVGDSLFGTHSHLVQQGRAWGEHVSEPWNVLVLTGIYIFLSVGLGLPIFGLLSDIIVSILKSNYVFVGSLSFSPRHLDLLYGQPIVFSLIGLLIQCIDAVWFIFLCKLLTWGIRFARGRPIYARHGKRTLVIVDTPWVHQLVEVYVSKLFSQSYSFVSIDVHGANGMDHFVHRFTHRVARGVLLAVGRPDGRLTSLSKNELAIVLAIKQAAFIQNPSYNGAGSGPDIVTIGHNRYTPNLGSCCNNIMLPSITRGSFVDEILYDKLHESELPVTALILKSLSPKTNGFVCGSGELSNIYGAHFIDLIINRINLNSSLADFLLNAKKKLAKKAANIDFDNEVQRVSSIKSSNPADVLAFETRLDEVTKEVNGLQGLLQQFYENRVASLERYIAFCVLFHALAISVNKPWLCLPWDVARSQSNLRVATTASPIPSKEQDQNESMAIKKFKRELAFKCNGYKLTF